MLAAWRVATRMGFTSPRRLRALNVSFHVLSGQSSCCGLQFGGIPRLEFGHQTGTLPVVRHDVGRPENRAGNTRNGVRVIVTGCRPPERSGPGERCTITTVGGSRQIRNEQPQSNRAGGFPLVTDTSTRITERGHINPGESIPCPSCGTEDIRLFRIRSA